VAGNALYRGQVDACLIQMRHCRVAERVRRDLLA
jgi:hypothetical protein